MSGQPVVALTRPEAQAEGTARRLAALGYSVLRAPLLAARPGDVGSPAGIGSIALTSRSAALALAAHPEFHHLPLFAVGDATAAEARRAGFLRVASAAGDVEALLRRVADAAQPIVHLAGAEHTGDLVERLVAGGRRAERRIAYTMELLPLPAASRVDAVLLYSPRTARHFAAEATGAWRHASCVALSPAVAQFLRAWRTAVAETPDEDALLAALATLPG